MGREQSSDKSVISQAKSIEGIRPKIAAIGDLLLESGQVLLDVQIAYETYGSLNDSRTNVILIAHGYAGNQHAAGYYDQDTSLPFIEKNEVGWWDLLIGPGKVIDTDRYFVISSNMLGSSYGSTGPATINPNTGKPYGPGFPEITITDMVQAQHALVTKLGVSKIFSVMGYSYGGYQAFQWAVTYPDMVQGIVVASSSPKGNHSAKTIHDLIMQFSQHPNWNNGWYYDHGGIKSALVNLRIRMLAQYGISVPSSDESSHFNVTDKAIHKMAEAWAEKFDANSLIVLRRAAEYRDAEKDFARIKAKVLYVLCKSDNLFPPTYADNVINKLKAYNIDTEYFELDSDKGHVGVLHDAKKWESVLRSFIDKL